MLIWSITSLVYKHSTISKFRGSILKICSSLLQKVNHNSLLTYSYVYCSLTCSNDLLMYGYIHKFPYVQTYTAPFPQSLNSSHHINCKTYNKQWDNNRKQFIKQNAYEGRLPYLHYRQKSIQYTAH